MKCHSRWFGTTTGSSIINSPRTSEKARVSEILHQALILGIPAVGLLRIRISTIWSFGGLEGDNYKHVSGRLVLLSTGFGPCVFPSVRVSFASRSVALSLSRLAPDLSFRGETDSPQTVLRPTFPAFSLARWGFLDIGRSMFQKLNKAALR